MFFAESPVFTHEFRQNRWHKSYPLKVKEANIVATIEIEVAHGLARDTNTIYDELQQVIHGVGPWYSKKTIKTYTALRYVHWLIVRANKEEENAEGKKRKTMTGKIKVYGLIQKRKKQSDPNFAW